jgi:hypothetical protein
MCFIIAVPRRRLPKIDQPIDSCSSIKYKPANIVPYIKMAIHIAMPMVIAAKRSPSIELKINNRKINRPRPNIRVTIAPNLRFLFVTGIIS